MLRAVIDTNIFISALIKPTGAPAEVVRALVDRPFALLLSPAMLEELRRALTYRGVKKYLRLSKSELESWVAALETLAEPAAGLLALNAGVRDANDLKVLAAAVEGRADCIVTGDADLLVLGAFEAIEILTARSFLERLSR